MIEIPPIPHFFDLLEESYSMTPEMQLLIASKIAAEVEENSLREQRYHQRQVSEAEARRAHQEVLNSFVKAFMDYVKKNPELSAKWAKLTKEQRIQALKNHGRKCGLEFED